MLRVDMEHPSLIVVATDFSEASEKAARVALDLAAKTGARVHLVHVWQQELSAEDSHHARDPVDEPEPSAQRAMRAALWRYRAEAHDVDGVVVCGDPRDAVSAVVTEKKAELLVVGTHNRRGLRRALLGSVAEALARDAPCTVLVVR